MPDKRCCPIQGIPQRPAVNLPQPQSKLSPRKDANIVRRQVVAGADGYGGQPVVATTISTTIPGGQCSKLLHCNNTRMSRKSKHNLDCQDEPRDCPAGPPGQPGAPVR